MNLSPTTTTARHVTAAAGALSVALLCAACGSSTSGDSPGGGGGSSTRPLSVVASTNVWGDVAQAVGGEDVTVSSIISDPSQDPHSFEANTKTLLMVSKAQVVIENGGGYDDFMGRMTKSSGSEATVINAVDVSGKEAPADGELNEHVWYDFATVEKVVDVIATRLGRARPEDAQAFTRRADALSSKIDALVDEESSIKRQFAGKTIGITEPVPLYLTEACGLVNTTPEEFSEAVEEGDDVSPAVLKRTLDQYTTGKVDALVYNAQTSGPVTEKVEAAAKRNGTGVVPVTETLPEGLDYVSWMGQNLDHLRAALGHQ